MPTAKVFKKKATCPVCDSPATKRYTLYINSDKTTCYHSISIRCKSDICEYQYTSHGAKGSEAIGFINIAWDGYVAHMPNLKKMKSLAKKYSKLRDAAIEETRRLIRERDIVLILECFRSENANKKGLADRLETWILAHAEQYPLTSGALQKRKDLENQEDERQGGADDSDSDDHEQDSSGGDS